MMSLRVALRIADERARRHLATIISLAAQRAAPIRLVKPSDSGSNAPQVIVVCEGEPGADQLLESARDPNAPRVIVYGPCQRDYPWVLPSPATTESLQNMMRQIVLAPVVTLGAAAANADHALLEPSAPAILLNPVEPCDFLQAIAQARAENRILELVPDGLETFIYIDGANDRVYATDAFNLLDQRAYVDVFTQAGRRFRWLPQLPRQVMSLNSCSLEAVIWSLAYAQPLSRITSATLRLRFSLCRWPYFSEFRYSGEQLTWSARLVREPVSLAALTGGDPKLAEMVVRFYNACIYSGIALPALVNASDAESERPQSRWRSLLGKLRGEQ